VTHVKHKKRTKGNKAGFVGDLMLLAGPVHMLAEERHAAGHEVGQEQVA
jgi:hypothetical protein